MMTSLLRSGIPSLRPERWLVTESVARTDFLRRPLPGRAGHREWLHYSIALPDFTLIVNVSVTDDPTASSKERGRAVIVARNGAKFYGGAAKSRAATDLDVRGGRVHMRVGNVSASLGPDGTFRLSRPWSGATDDVGFDLELDPVSLPSVASEVPVGATGEAVNWVVVPDLRATGTVILGGVLRRLDDAPAYHDHNWGYFSHRNFAWEWGHSVAEHPVRDRYSAVFARLLNGAHSETFMQSLLLWKDGRQHRVFRENEIEVTRRGYLRPEGMLTVPRELALLAGGLSCTNIPRTFHFRAAARGDAVEGCFESASAARIVVPNEHDLGTTLIHEVVGRLVLDGRVRGESVRIDGDAVFEFLGRGP